MRHPRRFIARSHVADSMMRVALAAVIAVVLGAAQADSANAQQNAGQWQTYASGDEILALERDPLSAALLWAGTEGGGLVQWDLGDGSFEQYLFPQQPGLASNHVRDIAFDSQGDPWLATSDGVTLAAGSPWLTYGTNDGLPSADIAAVAVASDDTVWAGTRSLGVAELRPGTNFWDWHEFDVDELGSGAESVVDMAVSPVDDTLWVAHGRAQSGDQPALSVYDPDLETWEHIDGAAPGGDDDLPPTDQILALTFDATGVLWAGSWSRGVLRYDGTTWESYTDQDGVCGRNVWAIEAAGSEVWVACGAVSGSVGVGTGVAHWDGAAWATWTVDDNLPTDTVLAIAMTGGTAYLGTNGPDDFGDGIVPISTVVESPLRTAPDTLPQNDVTAVAFDDRGQVWVGTRGAGLMTVDDGQWETYTRESTDLGLAGDLITDLTWADGRLWIASSPYAFEGGRYVDGGVSALDPVTGDWLTLTVDDGLYDDVVSSVAVDADGQVWIGFGAALGGPGVSDVHRGQGVVVYDSALEEIVASYDYDDTGAGLIGNTVMDLAINGVDIWAAASYHTASDGRRRGGGASLFEDGEWFGWGGGDEGFKSFHGSGNPSDQDPFITGDVRSVAVASDRHAYAGTWDLTSGSLQLIWPYVNAVVNEWDGSGWVNATFDGSGWVSALVEDGSGRVWAGTTRGHDLHEVDPAGGEVLDTATGGVRVQSGAAWLELTPGNSGLASHAITSAAVDPLTGDVWLGTENGGLSVFYAGEIPPTNTPGGPTSTPRPSATSTVPAVRTLPPTSPPGATPTDAGGGEPPVIVPTSTPKPPKEIPEPSTLLLLGAGLAGLAAWRKRQGDDSEDADAE